MTVYRALDIIPSQTKLPEKPPTASIALHLSIENVNKRGRGRKPARERIEAMMERDYGMVKNGKYDDKLNVAYDNEKEGMELEEENQKSGRAEGRGRVGKNVKNEEGAGGGKKTKKGQERGSTNQ